MSEINKESLPGNQIIKKPEEKVVKKVTTGAVRTRKEPLLYRIFGGETARSIGSYVIWDVVVPAIKSTITDVVTNSVEMIFYGDTKRSSNRLRRDRGRTYVSYNSIYSGGRRGPETIRTPRARDRHNFEDIIIETRSDADHVLGTLVELIDVYGLATVTDFYDSVGLTSEYTDSKYGWESLAKASVRPTRGGYIIDMPQPYPIE